MQSMGFLGRVRETLLILRTQELVEIFLRVLLVLVVLEYLLTTGSLVGT